MAGGIAIKAPVGKHDWSKYYPIYNEYSLVFVDSEERIKSKYNCCIVWCIRENRASNLIIIENYFTYLRHEVPIRYE